jgi:pullulanase-type alpha-1,6-glucosidase
MFRRRLSLVTCLVGMGLAASSATLAALSTRTVAGTTTVAPRAAPVGLLPDQVAEPSDAELVRDPIRPAVEAESFYFVLPDRFSNGDPGNDHGGDASGDPLVDGYLPTDTGYYHGGDLDGLTSKLDYLEGLGITAIWLTPQYTNRWVQGDGTITGSSAGYHGYWQIDYATIDPHFGTNAEMADLIDAAHARGMKVFFDVVLNHTGDVITYEGGAVSYRDKTDFPYRDADGVEFDDADYAGGDTFPQLDPAVSFPYVPVFDDPADATAKNPDWLNDPTNYHNRGDSTFAGESSLYGDFVGLDDLFTEQPDVVAGLIEIHQAMITEFEIDGFRIDTVKHVNDEAWEVFVPAVIDHARDRGIDDFTVFGEVYEGDPAVLSRFTTGLPLPGVLDFGFQGAAVDFAARSGATDRLAELFAADDYYTDADSNAHGLGKFTGNHDLGRIGLSIRSNAPSEEWLARARLADALLYLTRGFPIVYYGDEQGFTGDGGDQGARQDLFPSQVDSYNDDALIGTSATTAEDNFDPGHPLYLDLAALAQLRADHPALATGAQLHRYSQPDAGIYAFSRIDATSGQEIVVALNNAGSDVSAAFTTDSPATSWIPLWPAGGQAITSDADGELTVSVPALDVVVYAAEGPMAASGTAPAVEVTTPAGGSAVTGRPELGATVDTDRYAEVTFAVSIDGEPFTPIGTDDNAPYRVFPDVSGYPAGTELTMRAIAADRDGNLSADQVSVVVGEEPAGPSAGDHAVIHYLRDDGDYGDHTSSDFDDYWGLHLWGDIDETIDWTSPEPFLGEDDYGRFAWIDLAEEASQVGVIVHRGDTKDGTDADRFFDPSSTPEIWLRSDDAAVYTSQAAAQGYVTIHYRRPDGEYGDPSSGAAEDYWGLHLWGDGITPDEATEWASPKPPDGIDGFGAWWTVDIADAEEAVNFIIHRGDDKDPGPDESLIPAETPSAWKVSGDPTVHPQQGAADGTVTIHYHRPDGDYGDPTSDDFTDFWGLHTWGGAEDPGWTTPRRPAGFDSFGAAFTVPLLEGASELGYLLHRGDEKDPGPDQLLDVGRSGYEVWQVSGADVDDPYVLPLAGATSGGPSGGDLDLQQAHWVSADTVVWPAATDPDATYHLHWSPTAGLDLADGVVTGGQTLPLTPGDPFPTGVENWFHLAGMPTLTIDESDLADVPDALRSQLAVSAVDGSGALLDATGLQVPGVLDDLYATDADLGVVWDGEVPTIRLWAPTAHSVNLLLFDDSAPDSPATEVAMTAADDGTWSVTGEPSWTGRFYLFEVTVFAPSTGAVETNLVTDPYSLSLAANSTRSQIVDLDDPALVPEGWATVGTAGSDESVIYELHIRDFSALADDVDPALRGTFGAFTVDSAGTDHLTSMADAGLTHVHLLPAFDLATVNEDRSTWQSPDPAELAAEAPDSEAQQAAVTATAEVDGFNWGYDPLHYTVPEGSYSTDPDGATRIVEFREMVQALDQMGLGVVLDVVYNHTNASGQADASILDRIVPGYYHRLSADGEVETSTCCANTATEHRMMERLMVDSVVTWASRYRVSGFRFDLMGHHSKANLEAVRAALDELTVADDGIDGSSILLYGEGWNFGEVADNARFTQATQTELAGTGIATFNDRARDAARGGGPFDDGIALVTNQGAINGLWYDPNEEASAGDEEAQRADLLLSMDQLRVGLAGNLADYAFVDRTGAMTTGSGVDYNGAPTGYTAHPGEQVVYVSAHDNQTLFDIGQYHHPLTASMTERVRAQNLGLDLTLLAQGRPFLHAGVELLRSKSFDRDSYNSGDWFNRLDFTATSTAWGSGLPPAAVNAGNWSLMAPRLADPALAPGPDDLAATRSHLLELLAVRRSSPLFHLTDAQEVQERLGFHNTGPEQVPGVIVMSLDDMVGADLDPGLDSAWVVVNVTDQPIELAVPAATGRDLILHPILASSSDAVVTGSAFDAATGAFTVPARTTAVFVEGVVSGVDTTPPAVTATLRRIVATATSGVFRVGASCEDAADPSPTVSADLNGVTVVGGDRVVLVTSNHRRQIRIGETLVLLAPRFELTVACSDAAGNSATATATPVFGRG